MKKYIFWLVLLLALAATACKKKADPEPPLPPETQTGANTFGCYINGVPWKPTDPKSGTYLALTLETGGIFQLYASNRNDTQRQYMRLFSQSINCAGTYLFKKNNSQAVYFVDVLNGIDIRGYDNDVEVDGELTITKYDIPNRIVSGRFWYTLRKTDGSVEIKATEGRFDCYAN